MADGKQSPPKQYFAGALFGALMLLCVAAATIDLPTTAFTRLFLTKSTAAAARSVLGVSSTNLSNPFALATNTVASAVTNWSLDFSQGVYVVAAPLTASAYFTAATNFPSVTNAYAQRLKLLPSGADRDVYFPTNWHTPATNNLTVVGTAWKATITNGNVGWLSAVAEGGNSQTNVSFIFRQEQR